LEGQELASGRLSIARDLARLTRAALARRVGISAAAVSQFESGAARPSLPTLARLAHALEVLQLFLTRPLVDTEDVPKFVGLRWRPIDRQAAFTV
jgi:transcriptional regulator with XRE-family HTH domain